MTIVRVRVDEHDLDFGLVRIEEERARRLMVERIRLHRPPRDVVGPVSILAAVATALSTSTAKGGIWTVVYGAVLLWAFVVGVRWLWLATETAPTAEETADAILRDFTKKK